MGFGGISTNNKMGMNKGGKMGNKGKSGNAFGGRYGGGYGGGYGILGGMDMGEYVPSSIPFDYTYCQYCNRNYNEETYNKHLNGCKRRYEEAQMRNKITKKPQGKTPLKITYGKGQINYSRYNSKGGKKNKLNYYYLF